MNKPANQPNQSANAKHTGPPEDAKTGYGQRSEHMTTSQGAPVRDTDHSLKAGPRGPVLLQDHHLREKITHFDHERIPERVVHARGAGAFGQFTSYGTAESICAAGFLEPGRVTRVFSRFSTVVGSRGSSDTVRDTRGFATKFYTEEGVFDLVGNNIPVFFIQDGIKFPDIVHAAKPHPDLEIPQAQSAHDTFWDFVSLHTPAQAHAIWQMSDRGIPRSFRMMEGFGIHTFRLINAQGNSCLAKFHWKPKLGVHSLTWEEAQLTSGADPDFHRRDLADAISSGHYPQWELGVQVFPDDGSESFEGIDLLDPTKIVPEELAPVQPLGLLELNENPSNYFAETEQVAFHPGHLVPGIDVTNDPLLQVRLFSYIDTQLSRLGGPNFSQLPINRPHAPINDTFRDGMHQQYIHEGIAPYKPNSLDGGCPFMAEPGSEAQARMVDFPEAVTEAVKERAEPVGFSDHFSQARLFYRSLTAPEQLHVQQGYSFELGKCSSEEVRKRQLQCLANIDEELCASVALALGLPAPQPDEEVKDMAPSPALSQVGQQWPVDGRVLGLVVSPETDLELVRRLKDEAMGLNLRVLLVAADGGKLAEGLPVDRSYLTARSVEFDSILVVGRHRAAPTAKVPLDTKAGAAGDHAGPEMLDPRVGLLLQETFRQSKAVAYTSPELEQDLAKLAIPAGTPGFEHQDAGQAVTWLAGQMALHRVWQRFGG
ncbi:Catalase HPII [Glutamicibacter creatinolyticus]|uniref:Catalase n=1 Tax=Glutamicibacter creatinolyticus TaxID=162496 RepID=A0A5B7WXC4_9MICC|nr:catalase [Glutamicibacter creatinolyticus]QCY48577.1 Catalase HPII [Glutamicibacter creatinolyticus]